MGGPPDQIRAQIVSLPASPHLFVQVSITPSGTVWLQAQRSGSWLGTTGAVSPPQSLSFSLYRARLGSRRSDASADCQHAQLARQKLNLRFRHWLEAKVCLTFEHIYKKRQNKTSKLLHTEVRVSKYLRIPSAAIFFQYFASFEFKLVQKKISQLLLLITYP